MEDKRHRMVGENLSSFQFGQNRQNLMRRKTSRLDEGWGSTLWGFCTTLNDFSYVSKILTLSWGYRVVAMNIVNWVFWKHTCNMMKIWKDTFAFCWPILASVCAYLSSSINPTPILNIGHRPEQGGIINQYSIRKQILNSDHYVNCRYLWLDEVWVVVGHFSLVFGALSDLGLTA